MVSVVRPFLLDAWRMYVRVNYALRKRRLGIIPPDDSKSEYRFDCHPEPLREDEGKPGILMTDLENCFSCPKLVPLPSSIGILDEDTNFFRLCKYKHHNLCIDNSWIWCICFLNIYSMRKPDKLDHFFINTAKN